MEPEDEKLFAVILMALICSFGVFFNLWAMIIIKRNDKVSNAVRIYFLADHIERVLICNITIFFTTTCAYTFFCVEEDDFTIGWLLNRIIGYVKVSIIISTNLFTLALTLNRFFAVFGEGRYYEMIITLVPLQAIILTIVPFALVSPLLLYEQASYYEPYSFGWWNYGEISNFIVANVWYNSCIAIWVVVMCLDTATALTIRKKLGKSGNNSVKKVDVQIMKQVMSIHLLSLSYFLTMRILDYLKAWEYWGNLDMMFFYDCLPATIDLFAGISRVFYLMPPKRKVSNSQITQTISRSRSSTVVTTVTGITKVE